jgi:hypothetical protein
MKTLFIFFGCLAVMCTAYVFDENFCRDTSNTIENIGHLDSTKKSLAFFYLSELGVCGDEEYDDYAGSSYFSSETYYLYYKPKYYNEFTVKNLNCFKHELKVLQPESALANGFDLISNENCTDAQKFIDEKVDLQKNSTIEGFKLLGAEGYCLLENTFNEKSYRIYELEFLIIANSDLTPETANYKKYESNQKYKAAQYEYKHNNVQCIMEALKFSNIG